MLLRRFVFLPFLFTLMVCLCVSITKVNAQRTDTIRVMTYNILDFPGTDGYQRAAYLRSSIHYAHPDVVFTGEMTSQTGMNIVRDSVLNKYGQSDWANLPFIDGPDTDFGCFFRRSKLWADSNVIVLSTTLRNIYCYRLRPVNSDTTAVFYVYAMHLKASEGFELRRYGEASVARNHANNSLPTGAKFLYVGDFNFYDSATDSAYGVFTGSQANNNGRAYDALPSGSWHNNSAFRFIHTQSPRVRSFGGGVNGGMDDRFDFILMSMNLSGTTGSHYVFDSYRAYGNDGNHFNDSINARPNTAVPDSIADALHYGSDHLPVYADFVFAETTNSAADPHTTPIPEVFVEKPYPNPFNATTRIEYAVSHATELKITVVDETGREVARLVERRMTAGYHYIDWNATGLASGNYFVRVQTANGFNQTIPVKLVK